MSLLRLAVARRRVDLRRLLLRFFEQLQRDLQLAAAAFELLELGALARQHRDQVFELPLLRPRHLAQPRDALPPLDVEPSLHICLALASTHVSMSI